MTSLGRSLSMLGGDLLVPNHDERFVTHNGRHHAAWREARTNSMPCPGGYCALGIRGPGCEGFE